MPSTPEPEPPNPFNELTDQELDEYRKEVQRKQKGDGDGMTLFSLTALPWKLLTRVYIQTHLMSAFSSNSLTHLRSLTLAHIHSHSQALSLIR